MSDNTMDEFSAESQADRDIEETAVEEIPDHEKDLIDLQEAQIKEKEDLW